MKVSVSKSAAEIARREVVPILLKMLAFDTEAESFDSPLREEAAHQQWAAELLREHGAEVQLIEPDAATFSDHRMAFDGQSFGGRPILWARFPGRPGGRTLLFNGHYDTVPAGDLSTWEHSPAGSVAGDRVYGRGACDMKGGNAAVLASLVALAQSGTELPGDVFVNLVPFEEVNGMGSIATMRNGFRADAAVCPEPTCLQVLGASRGIMELEIVVTGRAAHGEIDQPHHSEGGAVNAIDKLNDLLFGIRSLNEQWRTRPDKRHPLLSPPRALVTTLAAGTFWATWPATASAEFDVTYLPSDADDEGGGSRVRSEIEEFVGHMAACDEWLVANPPELRWRNDFLPAQVPLDSAIITEMTRLVAHPDGLGGFDSWADHVSLISEGGIPTVLFGPGSILEAHSTDEFVPVDDLERCAELFVELAGTWGNEA